MADPTNFEGFDNKTARGRSASSPSLTRFDAGAVSSLTELDDNARGFIVHSAGVTAIRTASGDNLTFDDGDLVVGVVHPIEITHLLSNHATKITVLH